MKGGYTGRMLMVDLSSGQIDDLPVADDRYELFMGGYGIGADFVYRNQPAGMDALSQESYLGFVTGPLTGTPAISATRFTVVGKSPLTGGWGDANCGGYFGPELKRSGYDMIFLRGIASEPVALIIEDRQARLISAIQQWGLSTRDTESEYRAMFGKQAQIACIGPAGERKALISGIVNNGRLAARSGLGAVMGSKHLKAVVTRGSLPVPLAHARQAEHLRRELLEKIGGPWAELWKKYGTAGALSGAVEVGDSPVKNWAGSAVDFPDANKISDDEVLGRQNRRYGCWHCPIACGGYVRQANGAKVGMTRKPEYETLSAFGPLILNDNLDLIIGMNEMCDQAGLDTISAGTVIAYAIECFENGILTLSDTGGLALHWADGKAAAQLLRLIIQREGIGDLLADGVSRAVERIGVDSDIYAMHIGNQELPMHDPRLTMPFLMGYLLDATPARHNQGSATLIDMPSAWNKLAGAGLSTTEGFIRKTEEQYKLANLVHAINASGLCIFGVCSFMDRFILPDFLEVITGWRPEPAQLMEVGERIGTLRTAFNFREGLEPGKWKAPDRVLGKPPLVHGPLAGKHLAIEDEIRAFRERAGWDPGTGKPTPECLSRLGMDYIVQDIW